LTLNLLIPIKAWIMFSLSCVIQPFNSTQFVQKAIGDLTRENLINQRFHLHKIRCLIVEEFGYLNIPLIVLIPAEFIMYDLFFFLL